MHGLALSLAPVLTIGIPLLGAMGLVMVAPVLWLPLLAVAAVLGVGLLALRHPTVFCVAWLLVTGATVEMADS